MLIRSLAEFEAQGRRVIAISHGKSSAVRLFTGSDGVGLAVRPAQRANSMQAFGTAFQFRALVDSPLSAFAVTMPPWPAGSDVEWMEVTAHWPVG